MFGKKDDKPKTAKELYGKKPMSTKEQTEKAGFPSERAYNQYRKEADLRPEQAKRTKNARFKSRQHEPRSKGWEFSIPSAIRGTPESRFAWLSFQYLMVGFCPS